VAVRNGFLLPMRVVMALFRGKLRAAIREGLRQGRLTPPRGKSLQQLDNLLNKVGRAKWNVYIRERYPHGRGVLVYLARYLRGGPLFNRRLLSCDGEQVVFRYAERAKGPRGQAHQRTMSCPLEQFLGRWLLDVPPSHAVRVRCWGLYAHTQGDALARCRQQVGQGPVEGPKPGDGPREDEAWGEAPPECCPVCGQRLVCTALPPPRRSPTASRAGLGAGSMRGRTAVGGRRPTRREPVWPAEGRRGPCVSLLVAILPRPLPFVVPTAHGACDVSLKRERHRGGIWIQAPQEDA
jgi:Putative transposase